MSYSDWFKQKSVWGKSGHALDHKLMGTDLFSFNGLSVSVYSFSIYEFSFTGGTITLPAAGTWYVGIEIATKILRVLPRLGHRGWIPIGCFVCTATTITNTTKIVPVMPTCRIPRTMAKLRAGAGINVVVMGSSLAEGGGLTDWSGMLFNQASSVNAYRIPGIITFNNVALGGTPNQYQLAQLGIASSSDTVDYDNSGFANVIGSKTPPNGRTTLLSNADVVVITMLANGGEYRLQCVEAIVRKLRKAGVEVILTTDNPQNPGTDYATLNACPLYVDGPEVMRIGNLYGCEIADTAAYVFDAVLRYPAVTIYRDSIHMQYSNPAGRLAIPGGGYEVYARAIRSLFTVEAAVFGTQVSNYDFNSGLPVAWTSYNGTTISIVSNQLLVTAKAGGTQWGAWIDLPSVKSGDTVSLTFDLAYASTPFGIEVGLQGGGGGWGDSTHPSFITSGTGKTVNITASRDIVGGKVLFYVGSSTTNFTLDNVTLTTNSTYESGAIDGIQSRPCELLSLPPATIVTDYKTPADAFVILPKDEYHLRAGNLPGTLGASPLGSGSFARRFSSEVGASQDLLTLVTGQRAAIAAFGAVAFSVIYYSVTGDPQITIDVYRSNTFVKTLTIPASTITREIYLTIYTPTEFNATSGVPNNGVVDLRVTSGTLRIAALVALTSDIDFIPPEQLKYSGTWTAKIPGGAPNMMGYATDTLYDYASVQCPPTGRRIAFIVSSKVNSKAVNTWSGKTSAMGVSTAGVNHIALPGNNIGPGDYHYIQCAAIIPGGGNGSTGYSLHVGGAIVVNDR